MTPLGRFLLGLRRPRMNIEMTEGEIPFNSLSQLERSETDDSYWNAAQSEMVLNGKMHGYMRMY